MGKKSCCCRFFFFLFCRCCCHFGFDSFCILFFFIFLRQHYHKNETKGGQSRNFAVFSIKKEREGKTAEAGNKRATAKQAGRHSALASQPSSKCNSTNSSSRRERGTHCNVFFSFFSSSTSAVAVVFVVCCLLTTACFCCCCLLHSIIPPYFF
jgi:hypothetical protein